MDSSQRKKVDDATSHARTMVTCDENGVPFPKFEDKENLHPSSKKALKKMGLTTMTEIQYKTFDSAASGQDILGRARTGTGKTMAFLLPAIERLQKNPAKDQINMLILSPTRELAAQIGEQARLIISSHSTALSYQIVFGGSPKNQDIRKFERKVPTILVATPGRLRDHIDSTVVNGKSFASLLRATKILVLDETDRLLDMGFRREVHDIITYLPHQRQTLLFSATMPPEVRQVMAETMKPDYVTVDCIHDGDPASHTNKQVDQSHVVIPADKIVSGTVQTILHLMEQPDSKLVVFFPTAHLVAFYSTLFNEGLGKSVLEIHSRKSQSYRTSASNRFREVNTGALFSSDVSARGVDYPNVTKVVQFGIADSRESYIHRLGRTGRGGKNGQGLLVLSDLEKGFLNKLKGLDVPVDQGIQKLVDASVPQQISDMLDPIWLSIGDGTSKALAKSGKEAYRSVLGFYNGKLRQIGVKGSPTDKLVQFANSFAEQIGFQEPPAIQLKTLRKMGMDGTPGLVVDTEPLENKRGHRGPSQNPHARKKTHIDAGGAPLTGAGTYGEWGRASAKEPSSNQRNSGSKPKQDSTQRAKNASGEAQATKKPNRRRRNGRSGKKQSEKQS